MPGSVPVVNRPPTGPARLALVAGIGYLAGTFPSADIAARVAARGQVDLRRVGSRNPGGTNVAKVIGPGWGAAVMFADMVKGLVACRVGQRLAGSAGAHVNGPAAVVGHCLPVWARFRGGKGVATSVGQVLATFPAYFPIDFVVAYTTISNRRLRNRTFAATVAASVSWVACAALWWRKQWPNPWGPAPTAGLPLAAAASSAVILLRFVEAGDLRSAPDPTPTEVQDDAASIRCSSRKLR